MTVQRFAQPSASFPGTPVASTHSEQISPTVSNTPDAFNRSGHHNSILGNDSYSQENSNNQINHMFDHLSGHNGLNSGINVNPGLKRSANPQQNSSSSSSSSGDGAKLFQCIRAREIQNRR